MNCILPHLQEDDSFRKCVTRREKISFTTEVYGESGGYGCTLLLIFKKNISIMRIFSFFS